MDALVKQAAEQVRAYKETRCLTRHLVCCLGQVTYVTKNYKTECVGEDGSVRTAVFREAQEVPKRKETHPWR